MSITIVRRPKQVVGPATEREPSRAQKIYPAVRNMAIGDLMLSYPEMSRQEAEARIDGDVVCNPLHESAIKLRGEL